MVVVVVDIAAQYFWHHSSALPRPLLSVPVVLKQLEMVEMVEIVHSVAGYKLAVAVVVNLARVVVRVAVMLEQIMWQLARQARQSAK
jgi:hypothetical protein